MKSLYLAMADASSKWTSRMRGWDKILSQLSIFLKAEYKKAMDLWISEKTTYPQAPQLLLA